LLVPASAISVLDRLFEDRNEKIRVFDSSGSFSTT